jgi:hypothetical protein
MSTMVVLVICGLFSIFCAAMNFEWFVNSRKARLFVKIFGRNGARVFYILLGIALVAGGIGNYLFG